MGTFSISADVPSVTSASVGMKMIGTCILLHVCSLFL